MSQHTPGPGFDREKLATQENWEDGKVARVKGRPMEILAHPAPELRTKNRAITEKESGADALYELADTLSQVRKTHRAWGLAAPQVGINRRVAVIRVDPYPPLTLINPEIESPPPVRLMTEREGCLSLPRSRISTVTRPSYITVRWRNLNGDHKSMGASGLLARVIFHEVDYLNGILILDRHEHL